MLEGGVIARRPYLIVGPSGTGKTTLALQFLCEGVRRGERCLLVTIEEPPNEARLNHRGFGAEFDRVEVFDAIPDVMRYERVPFKDISAVRSATPFAQVPLVIRRTPELTGVEVTITALEQMLRSEVARRGYTRIVVDSLTALQYFCMKGFNEVAGAQTFLRFLSDLHVTTLLTVESPLEDVDTTERMLARGEIRLFRWELDDSTVRAIGVEKFRGSSHDVRLHPYRIGPQGLDINLSVTVSRDTRQIIQPVPLVTLVPPAVELGPAASPLDSLTAEVNDLTAAGADVAPIRAEIEAAVAAVAAKDLAAASVHVARAAAIGMDLSSEAATEVARGAGPSADAAVEAQHRIATRAESSRTGVAPTTLPPARELSVELDQVLASMPVSASAPEPVPPEPDPEPERSSASPEPPSESVPAKEESAESAPPGVGSEIHEPAEVAPAAGDDEGDTEPDTAVLEAAPVPTPTAVEVIPAGPPPPFPTRAAAPPDRPRATPPPPVAPPTPPRPASAAPRRAPPPEPPVLPSAFPPPKAVVAENVAARPAPPSGPTAATEPVTQAPMPGPRTAPPPLPTLSTPPPRTAPVPPGPAAPPVHAASPEAPPALPATISAVDPSTTPSPEAVATTAPSGTKRKRKGPTRTARKGEPSAEGEPASPPGDALGGREGVPSLPTGSAPSPETEVADPEKPRRRAARKRKAPTVVSATAGEIPPGVLGSDLSPAPPPAEPPAKEGGG